MGQLVKANLADLGALPLVDIFISLNVGEGHLGNDVPILVPEPPLAPCKLRVRSTDAPVNLYRFIPKAALSKNLIEIAAEDGAAEAGNILVAER